MHTTTTTDSDYVLLQKRRILEGYRTTLVSYQAQYTAESDVAFLQGEIARIDSEIAELSARIGKILNSRSGRWAGPRI